MTRIVVVPDRAAVARLVAASIEAWLEQGLAERGRAHLALGGGRTPAAVHAQLASLRADWRNVELWLGDERIANPRRSREGVARNIDLVRATLVDRIGTPVGAVHAVPELSPEDAAASYAREMAARLPEGRLDVAYLGLGPDGHTASLFPHAPELAIETRGCAAVRDAPKPPRLRVTMTIGTLRSARHVIIAATGADKAEAAARILGAPDRAFPASLLGASLTELVLDEAAASLCASELSEYRSV